MHLLMIHNWGESISLFPVSSSFLCLLMLPFLCLLNSFLSFPVGIDVLYIGPLKGEPHHSHTHSVGLCASAMASSPSSLSRLSPQNRHHFNHITALVLCVLLYEHSYFVF